MTADNIVTRAAEVLIAHTRTSAEACHCGWGRDATALGKSHAKHVAQAFADAGLLRSYPYLMVEGDWVVEVVDRHTCGAGPGSGAGHEPDCGTIPVGQMVTPEHDRAVAADAWARGYGAGYADRVAERPFDRGDNPHEDVVKDIEARDAEVRADEREKVLAGFTEEWAVASDIAATVIPMPPTLARKVAALGVDARVVRRHVGPWEPVVGDES